MRPRVQIITKGLEESLKTHVSQSIDEKGPLTELDLWKTALEFFTPQLSVMSASLIRTYKLQFGRKIGKKTAEMNVLRNLRLLLSRIKKSLRHTDKPIIVGGKRFGRIFYSKGQEGKIQQLLRKIVLNNPGRHKEVLNGIKKGPVRITPSTKRAAELLEHYGLVEIRKIGGQTVAVEPGFSEISILKEAPLGNFPSHFKIWKPFKIETWVLKEGPEKITIRFDEAGWDPVNKVFYLGLKKDYVNQRDLRNLKEKSILLKLPSKLIVFCSEASEGAKKFAQTWGIEIKYKNDKRSE